MAYVCVAKALYDYEAQDPEGELSFSEDQVLYVIDKEDEQWWKAKLKPAEGQEDSEDADKVGLVPANYVEEIPPISYARALYAYTSTAPDELTIPEDALLEVFSADPSSEWHLVRIQATGTRAGMGLIGFVPGNYTEAVEDGEVGGTGSRVTDGDVDAPEEEEEEEDSDEQVRGGQLSGGAAGGVRPVLKDSVETWSVSLLDDKKKKKKGTLGVGNGAVFFASESDKTPVQQYPITTLRSFTQPASKSLLLNFSNASAPLSLLCSDKTTADAIMSKLESSKSIAGGGSGGEREVGGLGTGRVVDSSAADDGDDEEGEAPPTAKGVRWAAASSPASPATPTSGSNNPFPPPPQRTASATSIPTASARSVVRANVLYDFEAQGEDELPVREGDVVEVIDKENEDWWTVKNASGQQGVVPAQYVELATGASVAPTSSAPPVQPIPIPPPIATMAPGIHEGAPPVELDSDEEDRYQAERARMVDAKRAEEKRKRAEKENLEKEARAEEDRARRERKERRRAEEIRRAKEEEAARRRELARSGTPPQPPKLKQRPSANDVAAARDLAIPRNRSAPERPAGGDVSGSGRSRPSESRTRIWHDKTGQFRVEAEFLGTANGKIRLHKLNGVVIEVPYEKMSKEDINYIKAERARTAHSSSSSMPKHAPPIEDDEPLARAIEASKRTQAEEAAKRSQPSIETRSRSSPSALTPQPTGAQRKKKPTVDWFTFFLDAGCDMDDCTRYAGNFDRDRIDETILPDLDAGQLRSLGLREGDVIRVKKAISIKFRKVDAEQEAQIKKDEELARQVAEAEKEGRPIANLFTNSDGKLANNTRRGRPERKGTDASIDADRISAASQKLSREPSPPLLAPSPPPPPRAEPPKQEPKPVSGFDDDAWTLQPNMAKPATPVPAAPTPLAAPKPQQAPSTLANQLNGMTMAASNTGNSAASFDVLSQIPARAIVNTNTGYQNGLGMQNSGMTMAQMQQQQQQQQQPGPLLPTPQNQGLLQPLIPTATGFNGFVPTRTGAGMQMGPQMTGYQQPMPMYAQPTGYGFGQQQQQFPQQQQYPQQGMMMPMQTGYQPQLPAPNPAFQQLSAIPQQQMLPQMTGLPAGAQNTFAPSSIFANMKKNQGIDAGPQGPEKYEALRPLTTGYNGAPGGVMMPQQTGMMPQATGMYMPQQGGMYPNQTGYPNQGYRGY